jgi:hypothetical protein
MVNEIIFNINITILTIVFNIKMSISSDNETFISQIDYMMELTGGLFSNVTIEKIRLQIHK